MKRIRTRKKEEDEEEEDKKEAEKKVAVKQWRVYSKVLAKVAVRAADHQE